MPSIVYLSDLAPTEAINGWGTYERDRSNGESGAADGGTLTLNGTTYSKGLGVHASSSLTYSLGGNYSRFQSIIGIDDEVGSSGSVVFKVLADGVEIFRSNTLTGVSNSILVDLDVTGVKTLQLKVDNAAGTSLAFDHANWADAKLITASTDPVVEVATPAPATPPSISLALAPTSVKEDDDANLVYTFSRSGDLTNSLTVYYTLGGTASNDTDYTGISTSGTTKSVTFAAGSATAAVNVNPTADTTFEVDETVALTLAAGSGYTVVTTGAVTGTISNDEVGTAYLSDLTPTASTNGWGPYERDRSNGESGATDGRTLTLNGTTYAKGLGVHSFSSLTYALAGSYSSFEADIGVDDEVGDKGSVVFRVLADGGEIFRSSTLTGASVTQSIRLNVAGVQNLQLIVENADGSTAFDHANWANAKLINATAPSPATEPINSTAPLAPSGAIPLSWDDPVFASVVERTSRISVSSGGTASNLSIVEQSGLPSLTAQGSVTVDKVRIRSREGYRGVKGEQYLSNMFIEAHGISSDHADGLQMYSPGSTGRITLKNSTLKASGQMNAAYWSANDWKGAHVLENVLLRGGTYSLKINGDGGSSMSLKNVFFEKGSSMYGPMNFTRVNNVLPAIVRWENVRYASIVNGKLVPGDLIPQPYGVARDYTDAITGTDGADVFQANSLKGNTYVGMNGNDTYKMTDHNQSKFSNMDWITDFSIGYDKFDGPNTQSITPVALTNKATEFTEAAFGALLNTPGNFPANGAAIFKTGGISGERVFVALNNGASSFSATEDSVIEITGYSGNLAQLQVI